MISQAFYSLYVSPIFKYDKNEMQLLTSIVLFAFCDQISKALYQCYRHVESFIIQYAK